MAQKSYLLMLVLFLASGLVVFGCSSDDDSTESSDDAASNLLQSAYSMAGSAASSTEGGSVTNMSVDPDKVGAKATCTYNSRVCSGDTGTISWDCQIGTASVTGGWSEAFSSGCCATGALADTCSVTRTTTGSGNVITFASGATLTTKSDSHTNYSGTTISGGVTVSNSSGTRTLTINGLQRLLVGPRGTTWFNHSIKTPSAFTVTGTRAAGTRTITSGTINIDHNIAEYTGSNSFSNVVWGDNTCCYPTSGTITTTLTGSLTGTASMTFSSTCGTASFTDTSGSSSDVTLSYCE